MLSSRRSVYGWFSSILHVNKLDCFCHCHFHLSLILTGKARSLLLVWSLIRGKLQPCLQWLSYCGCDLQFEHSILLSYAINYGCKSFTVQALGVTVIKYFVANFITVCKLDHFIVASIFLSVIWNDLAC
jgi:hypothetical protein